MKIKYFGTEYEKGLNLTVDLFNSEGYPIYQNMPMHETEINTAIYITEDVFNFIESLSPGIYVTRVKNSDGEFLGYSELMFDGRVEVTLLDIQFMTEREKMQLRDALGIDGNKVIARGGQLQKKSEYPYNSTVDSTTIE